MAHPNVPRGTKRTYATLSFSTAADGVSESVDITGYFVAGIKMSTAWTDANIGFKASVDGTTTFFNVYTSSGDFATITTSANRTVNIGAGTLMGYDRLQLVSETSAGVAVPQAAARTVSLALFTYVTGGN